MALVKQLKINHLLILDHIYYLIFLHLGFNLKGQELNAQVIVNSDLVNQTNQQIFKTLERALNEFINTQVWTNKDFLNQERITCSFVFNLSGYSNDKFEASLQVQSERPIFNTNYNNFSYTDISDFVQKHFRC